MFFALTSSLFAVACGVYLALDLQLLRGLGKLRKKTGFTATAKPLVTVLIAARNEENNLPRVLDALLAQTYPPEKFQVVVVNDRSEDGTEAVLNRYAAMNPERIQFITVYSVTPGMSPKKHALLKGLEIARGEWIAATDADCEMGPGWLDALSTGFTTETGMVLGFTGYREPEKGFATGAGVQALEFVSYGVVAAALVELGFPVIANANNLAYRREAFDEASALRKSAHIVSGDDDFVLQEIHARGKWRIRYCPHPESRMLTDPPESWNHFWEQRKRWASKCLSYGTQQVIFLAAVFAFYLSIPILLLLGFCNVQWALLGLGVWVAKTAGDFWVMRKGLKTLGFPALLRFFPLTALMHVPLVIAAVLAGTLGGFTWKGQKLSSQMPVDPRAGE